MQAPDKRSSDVVSGFEFGVHDVGADGCTISVSTHCADPGLLSWKISSGSHFLANKTLRKAGAEQAPKPTGFCYAESGSSNGQVRTMWNNRTRNYEKPTSIREGHDVDSLKVLQAPMILEDEKINTADSGRRTRGPRFSFLHRYLYFLHNVRPPLKGLTRCANTIYCTCKTTQRSLPPSAAYVNPSAQYPVYTTGPPLATWTSPRSTVMQFTNGRLQFDEARYPSHNPYYAQWPYSTWYTQAYPTYPTYPQWYSP
ncbi:hypothetical protein DFH06DRAFT_1121321 [Mycena polygramma]|nr:hypothetical protein DFH06DRAFT_1121321 [Mycena polygramma]